MVEFLAVKLFDLTQFASSNISIYFNFVRCWSLLLLREIFRAQSNYSEVYVKIYIIIKKITTFIEFV